MSFAELDFLECDVSTWNYILHPRPVAIVISGSWDEYSAMAASWVMPVSRRPPIVAIAIARSRYTYELILKYREFSLCILDSKHAVQVHKLGTVSGRNIKDKISYVGLTKAKSSKIRAPIVRESLAVAECILRDSVEAGDHDIVIGNVISTYIRRGLEIQNPKSYKPLLHVGGNRYTYPSDELIEVKST